MVYLYCCLNSTNIQLNFNMTNFFFFLITFSCQKCPRMGAVQLFFFEKNELSNIFICIYIIDNHHIVPK